MDGPSADSMKHPTVRDEVAERPSRLLIFLAAAWLILSLAIGGAVAAEQPSVDLSVATTNATQR